MIIPFWLKPFCLKPFWLKPSWRPFWEWAPNALVHYSPFWRKLPSGPFLEIVPAARSHISKWPSETSRPRKQAHGFHQDLAGCLDLRCQIQVLVVVLVVIMVVVIMRSMAVRRPGSRLRLKAIRGCSIWKMMMMMTMLRRSRWGRQRWRGRW